MQIKLLIEGGNMEPGPALSQKLGPIGINISQVIKKVNDFTKNFTGLKVPVELDVDPSTKEFEIKVFSPPVSELLKKELGIAKGSGMQKKITMYNASIEQIISVAKTKLPNMLSKNLKAAVKTVVGTCGTLGVLVENKSALEVEREIEDGKYDNEINKEITQTPPEKRRKLDEYFFEIKEKQEKVLKQEQAAKEAAAQAAETTAATPAAGATAATPTAEKATEETKAKAEPEKKKTEKKPEKKTEKK
ncbi:MAG: 50S ribosomal protein L11 [Nanoarchaeota archaeon]